MTTKEIQQLICKREVLNLNIVCENVSNFLPFEMDVCSVNKSGYLTEFEVKVSKSDFKADSGKLLKWRYFDDKAGKWIPNYFYYVCPENLITEEHLQDFAGLIYVIDSELIIIKPAKLIHKFKHDKEKILAKFCRVLSQRTYLGACLLTYQNNLINQRNKERVSQVKNLNPIFE